MNGFFSILPLLWAHLSHCGNVVPNALKAEGFLTKARAIAVLFIPKAPGML